jgi:hypothetical protein
MTRTFTRVALGLALTLMAWGCADKLVGPTPVVEPKGQIGVFADVGPAGVTTLVIQVSGPGIVKPDNSPDTLGFNIPLTNGVASGSINVPAGPNRVITARAFVGITETHRGSITANVAEGNNPTLQITLVPLVGNVQLTVSIGSTIVTVRPLLASVGVNDTLRLTAEIRDHNGQVVNDKVRWATLNPLKASVDTLGLVTVRDTGDVQIVATYGTVGGSAKVSGVFTPSVAANHLRWNGSVNTNWSEPNNWTPHGIGAARKPGLADSVVIPAGTTRVPRMDGCTDDNAVRDILIEDGATLNTSCYGLNVYRSAVIRGSINASVNLRPNATAAGKFQELYVYGANASLSDSVSASYVEVRIPVGTFTLNGKKLRITGDLYVPDGTITMAANDTVVVGGNINWTGDDQTGLITGGVVLFRGNNFHGPRYYGTGTSRVVLDRTTTGQQTISGFDYINNPNNSQIRRLEIRNRDGADICSYVRVTDTLSIVSTGTPSTLSSCSSYRVRAQGPVITGANTDVSNYEWELLHATGTSLVAGTWHPYVTGFELDNQAINPTLAYQNLRFRARNQIPANMTITGYLYLNGVPAELDLNGKKLTVGDYLYVENGGTLKMANAADSLIVGEYAYFPHDFHGAQKPKLTAGVISIGAYMYGFGFASAGTKVVMTGTGDNSGRYISGMNSDSRPAQEVHELEYAVGSTYSVCERTKVVQNVIVRAGATLNTAACSGALAVMGNLVTEATSSVNVYHVDLHTAAGTSNVAGAYAALHTDFNVANAIIKPGLAYGNVAIRASTQLTGATATTGYVYVSGNGVDLKINGHKLNVGNYLQFDNNSTLTMTNAADSVIVANYGYFNSNTSTAQESKLAAGVLSIGEYLYGLGFNASGTHKVVMAGTSANTQRYFSGMNYESRPTQGFQNLEIAAGKSYGVCERALVKGTLTVSAGATLDNGPCGGPYIRVDGNIVAPATSTIAPYNVALHAPTGTQNVDGTFAPEYTSLHTTAAANQMKAGLGYKSVQFFTPASLSANMTVNGELNVSGASAALTLNGKTLTVTGNLNVINNGIVIMDNAADVLDVSGNVSWSGSGSEAGKLTNGTAIFRGSTFCGSKYETSLAHKTVFQRATTDPLRFQCVGSSSTAQLIQNLDVKGSGALIECNMNVANDVHVFAGAALNMSTNCGAGTLYVGHDLLTDAGSTVTNGSNYPSSSQLSVVLAGSSGTSLVGGAYGAHATYFQGLNASIKPTLSGNGIDYKYVRIDQSMELTDSTEVDLDLEVINTSILNLKGKTLVVRGSLDLNNTARLKMLTAALGREDTLVVGSGDATADLIWDAGDNSTDGNPMLTRGAVKFYGNRFYGSQYKPQGGTNHRFIFMSTGTGQATIEGSPQFANMEIRGARPVVNTSGSVTVKDTLQLDGSATLGATTGTLLTQGPVISLSGSDISGTTIYLDGPNGTRDVAGRFRPTNTYFRSAIPVTNALRRLEYNNVVIAGPYTLSDSITTLGNLDIAGVNASLTLNSKRVRVTTALDIDAGGELKMTNALDSVIVGGSVRFSTSAATHTMTAGVILAAGNFDIQRNLGMSGSHKIVLNGTAAQTLTANASDRRPNNLEITGSGLVTISGSTFGTNGAFRILSARSVNFNTGGATATIVGTLESIVGSTLTVPNLSLSDGTGTGSVLGNLSVTGTATFTGSEQTIRVGTGMSYANMAVTGSATVSGGALAVPGTLTIGSGASLDVPTGSTLGVVNVSGSLAFLGSSLSTQTLTVNSGGSASATDLGSSFVDFGRIVLQSGGTMDNGSRSPGVGGFRYKTTGTFINFQNNAGGGYTSVSGTTPFASQP